MGDYFKLNLGSFCHFRATFVGGASKGTLLQAPSAVARMTIQMAMPSTGKMSSTAGNRRLAVTLAATATTGRPRHLGRLTVH
jgi:hypothetical protein